MFIIRLQLSSLLTYASIASAVIGISYAHDLSVAFVCLLLCAFFDIFDGKFARLFRGRNALEKNFGIAIDSLADTLAFVALPVAIFASLHGVGLILIVPIIYALTGVTRLSVFTAEAMPDKTVTHYRGLPITLAGLIIPLTYLLTQPLAQPVQTLLMSAVYLALAFLFVANIRVKKP